MKKKLLITINLILVVTLAFIIGYCYFTKFDDDFDQNRQYTLLLTQPIIEDKVQDYDDNDNIVNNNHDDAEISDNRSRVSFIIADLGINSDITNQVITNFPQVISFGFSPHTEELDKLLEDITDHDILLNLPTNKSNKKMLFALDNEANKEENMKTLSLILSQGDNNYIGTYTEPNDAFLINNDIIYGVMQTLGEQSKFLCYGGIDKITKSLAQEHLVGFINPDLVIEYDFNHDLIKEKLESISIIHKYQNDVLVFIKPSPIAIEGLSEFLLQDHDFEIVKITEMIPTH